MMASFPSYLAKVRPSEPRRLGTRVTGEGMNCYRSQCSTSGQGFIVRDLPHPNGYRKESVASKVGLPKGGDVTRLTLYEYAATVRPRHGRARKREKGRILDEFCET